MADGVVHYFKGDNRFETDNRSVAVAEQRTQTITVAGLYNDLIGLNLHNGSPIPSFVDGQTSGVGSLYIRDFTIAKDGGDMGLLTMNCVEASSLTNPYNVTVDVDLAQVEKKLVNHPLMKDKKSQWQIRLFNMTDDRQKFNDKGEPQSSFDLTSGDPLDGSPVKLTDKDAINYAKAALIGVDSYSVYLPVITRTSQYLKLPGVNIDLSTMEASGTANPDGMDKIGQFDTPPIKVSGFDKGLWFKNGDHFTQQANGGWTRVESWTYTNDLRTQWIYKDGAALEEVTGEDD